MVRLTIVVTVTALTLFAAARISFIDGILRPVSIDGPSMAPALLGAHLDVICSQCGVHFACDAEHVPASGLAECFNCGFDKIPLAGLPTQPPDRVLLDRWPLLFRAPQRHEVVACRDPHRVMTVKRVAALPGEHLQIVRGQLYNGSQLLQKTYAEGQALRVLVRVQQGNRNRFESSQEFTDYDAYNQGELRRPLNEVRHTWLECLGEGDCRIWRDIYYLDADGLSRPWQAPAALGQDEYALLGDNPPVSFDSRHWEPGGVSKRDILGLVYRPFWSRQR